MRLYESLIKNIGIGMATANQLAVQEIIDKANWKGLENLSKYLKMPLADRWLPRYCEENFNRRDCKVKRKPMYGAETRFSGEIPYAYYEQSVDCIDISMGERFAEQDVIDVCIFKLDDNSFSIIAGVPELDKVYDILDKAFTKHSQDTIQNHLEYTDMYIYDWKDTKTFNLTEAIK